MVALASGGGQPDLLAAQAAEFGVAAVAVASPAAETEVQAALRDHFSRTQWPSRPAASAASSGPDAPTVPSGRPVLPQVLAAGRGQRGGGVAV